MKRISIYLLSSAFAIIGMASCGKTTKGKMSNEWKVVSMEQVETYVNTTGDKHTSTFSVKDNTVTETDEDYPASGPSSSDSETGTMNVNDFVIKKDGTWSWIMDATYPTSDGTHQEILKETGSWSFLNKTKGDDFKKNERVLFNVLTTTAHDIVTENGVEIENYTDELTYTTGKSIMIYTVTESKKDKLELELENKKVFTQGSNTNTNSTSRTLILEAK